MNKKSGWLIGLIFIVLGNVMVPYDDLKLYKKRRDFTETPEPPGKKEKRDKKNNPIFVIQKHRASHLHYDFRIEMGGVLKSWAIPKGPSLNPAIKRLAVLTENHPMGYADFEGNIPEGHYGAGEVIVWDNGTFENIKTKNEKIVSLEECFKNGQIEVQLDGKKLHGSFALIRTSNKKNWLFIKMNDAYADIHQDPVVDQPESVISGRTIEDIKKGKSHKITTSAKKHVSKKNANQVTIKVGHHNIELTNQEKVLFGASGITKGDLVNYYNDIAPIMMPYIKNRAISMQRFPQGVNAEIFFQKDIGSYFPEWIKRFPVKKKVHGVVNYVVIDKPETLVYLANQAVTPHLWLSKIDNINKPDRIIFDLDPAEGLTFSDIQNVAKKLKKILDDLKLPTFFMLTGSRGAHVVVPIKRLYSFEQISNFAHDIALYAAQKYPKFITADMSKAKRGKRIFIDWLRNSATATAVAPYAVRALEGAPVAMPVTWQELCKKDTTSQKYTIKNTQKRIDTTGDIWKDMQKHAVSLTQAKKLFNTIKYE
jgi:bifunctional non-homologous end joining protein LigD